MSVSKIEIQMGKFKFTGEGEQKWLSEQLNKILKEMENIVNLTSSKDEGDGSTEIAKPKESSISQMSLAKLIKDSKATSQNMKFLAGAVSLSLKGRSNLKPSDVTGALRDAGQPRLSNPSENLAQNIQKGFLERVSKTEFMVTVHGKEQFGME